MGYKTIKQQQQQERKNCPPVALHLLQRAVTGLHGVLQAPPLADLTGDRPRI